MTEKQFEFGVDIPNSWKQKTMKNERRFTDLEGFLDEDYDGEHHMLWDNQKECWIHLDDALCLMEKQYREIKEENEQLKTVINRYEKYSNKKNDELNFRQLDILKLKEENKQLKKEVQWWKYRCGENIQGDLE